MPTLVQNTKSKGEESFNFFSLGSRGLGIESVRMPCLVLEDDELLEYEKKVLVELGTELTEKKIKCLMNM